LKNSLSIAAALTALVAWPANADVRAFDINGNAYNLKPDKSYQSLSSNDTDGRISFAITRGRDNGKECELSATLNNQSAHTVRYLKQCFKVFSQKGGDTVCFTFGGGRQSQSIAPQNKGDALGNFDKGTCAEIVGAEPYYFFNGRDPSSVSVDGLAPFEARQLFTFPDTGVIKISN